MKRLSLALLVLFTLSFYASSVRTVEIVNASSDRGGTAFLVAVSTPQTGLELRVGVREVSAYTLGRVEETDDTPCVGASGDDLCKLVQSGIVVYASNEFPLHTRISIDGVEGIVLDRMAKRYTNRIDVGMLDYQKAKRFGVQKLAVSITHAK